VWTCDLVGCGLLIAFRLAGLEFVFFVWVAILAGCWLLVAVWTWAWACGSTSLVTVWQNWACCPPRSGVPVTPLSGFIIFEFFYHFHNVF
jgi:hypothetical protein